MKRLTLSVGLCGLLASVNAWPVGFGEIQTESALNQPFRARVPLSEISGDQLEALRVALAPVSRFEAAGIPVNQSVLALRFEVATGADGKPELRIRTDQPMREPIVDFLIQASWPGGQLVREFTVLLDPPDYPGLSSPRPAAAPAQTTVPAAPVQPTAPVRPSQYGPVRSGDTLYAIALRMAPAGVDVNQMMIALLNANPDAFINGNINALKQGARLTVPSADEARRLSAAEAMAEVRAQTNRWRRQTPTEAPATPPQAATTTRAPQTPTETDASRLRLVAPEEGAGAANATENAGEPTSSADSSLLQEEVDARQRENRELAAKLKEANEIIQLLQRQIEFKDSELAALQQRIMALQSGEADAADAEADAVEAPAAELPEPATLPEVPVAEDLVEPAAEVAPESADDAPMGDDELEALLALPELDEIDAATPEASDAQATDSATSDAGDAEATDAGMASEPTAAPTVIEPETEAPAAVETPAAPAAPVAATPEAASGVVEQAREILSGIAESVASLVPPHILATIPGGIRSILGGVLLALLIVLLVARKAMGRGEKTVKQAPLPAQPATPEDRLETTVEQALQPIAESEDDFETGEAPLARTLSQKDADSMVSDEELDPLEEINVYLAYERFDQAEELVREAIRKEPDAAQYRLRLLEVFYSANDKEKYETAARELRDAVGEQSPLWESALAMWNEMSPSRELFSEEDLGATLTATQGSSAFVNLAGDDEADVGAAAPEFVDLTETTETPGSDDLADLTGTGELTGLTRQDEDLLDVSSTSVGTAEDLFDITGGDEAEASGADDNILEFDLEDTVSPPLAKTTMLLDDTHDGLTAGAGASPQGATAAEPRSTIEAADQKQTQTGVVAEDDNSLDFDIGGLSTDAADETWDPIPEGEAGDEAAADAPAEAASEDIETPSVDADTADTLDFNFDLGATTEVSRTPVEDTLELPRDMAGDGSGAPAAGLDDASADADAAEDEFALDTADTDLDLTLDFDVGEQGHQGDVASAVDAELDATGAELDAADAELDAAIEFGDEPATGESAAQEVDLASTAMLGQGMAQFRSTKGSSAGEDEPSLDDLDIDLTVEAGELGLDVGDDDTTDAADDGSQAARGPQSNEADLTLDELARTLVSDAGAVQTPPATDDGSASADAAAGDDAPDGGDMGPDDTFDLDVFGAESGIDVGSDLESALSDDTSTESEPTQKMAPAEPALEAEPTAAVEPLDAPAATTESADAELDDLGLDFGTDLDLDFANMADSDDDAGGLSLDDTGDFTTQLNLARAYVELGDHDGARNILNEVRSKGSEAEKAQAIELLGRIG